jgi:hypothetical protein
MRQVIARESHGKAQPKATLEETFMSDLPTEKRRSLSRQSSVGPLGQIN